MSIWMSKISDLTQPNVKWAFIFYTDNPTSDIFLYFRISERFP